MSADDIIFEPIGQSNSGPIVDQQMIDAVKIALTGVAGIEFFVDPDIDVGTYDAIADAIETDAQVVKYTDQMVKHVSLTDQRPAGALTLKEVFRRMHVGDDNFYFCAQANGAGVHKYKFTNWFGIDSQIPMIHVDQASGNGGFFEMWIMGLMSNNLGYNQYYCFDDWAEASKYYGVP